MPGSLDIYYEYQTIREKPFFDLLSLISDYGNMDILDLGCGTGKLTSSLAGTFKDTTVVGIDNSKEMLREDVYESRFRGSLLFPNNPQYSMDVGGVGGFSMY
ncbi:methyltransferase domain-containing protein [Allomuricauda taeanensis]|uniref:class I SAM-dependent methyltransferase n=1 Tax=Flagellimonas taeanensis TaxID=1005926 RepID=UPI002E7AE94C|nr:methyltransferase domain-containing protein [Allomuricauda taeanensis]MEE1964328.1 methyltransferase domain-containing protein [Allomuricauda taeanensis]